ncbi:MAG: biotin/lipoate A/B protein ligase family protein [Methanomassiliicoccus sp.]|nr:biotin/lipoate A/B protein ligase family protein [Methanomassiliicoccus sp.]
MRWRLLPFEQHQAPMNMAIDEAVAEAVGHGALPTVRFYGWRPSAVSIGRFQRARDEVDLDECARLGVDVVRRRTGGGAVYHDHRGEITYSVIAPEALMGSDITASYREVCGWVISALGDLGIDAEFAPINDVIASGRKISGCAQTRRQGVFLQHGTVLHDLDLERMFSVLRVDRMKLSDKAITEARNRVTSVRSLSGASQEALLSSLHRSFLAGKEWTEATLSTSEDARASELADSRYGDRSWTFSR